MNRPSPWEKVSLLENQAGCDMGLGKRSCLHHVPHCQCLHQGRPVRGITSRGELSAAKSGWWDIGDGKGFLLKKVL